MLNNQELQETIIDEIDNLIQYLSEFHPNLDEFRHFLVAKLDEIIANLKEQEDENSG
jgi:hypothetical protein